MCNKCSTTKMKAKIEQKSVIQSLITTKDVLEFFIGTYRSCTTAIEFQKSYNLPVVIRLVQQVIKRAEHL